MSLEALKWAFDLDLQDPEAKLLLLSMANYCDEWGFCWPSMKALIKKTSLSETTIRRRRERLCELGFVTIDSRQNDDGTCRANRYQLVMNSPVPADRDPVQQTGGTLAVGQGHPVPADTHRLLNLKKSPLKESKNDSLPGVVGGDMFGNEPVESKKGKPTRLPAGWEPSAAGVQFAVEKLSSERAAFDTLDEFRDYWTARAKDAARCDWEATWRNRVREVASRSNGGRFNGRPQRNGPATLAEQGYRIADELEARERAAGLR